MEEDSEEPVDPCSDEWSEDSSDDWMEDSSILSAEGDSSEDCI